MSRSLFHLQRCCHVVVGARVSWPSLWLPEKNPCPLHHRDELPQCTRQRQNQRRPLAGHNKWSKIKRKKGVKDVARATAFTKASRAIEAASRACGGDMADLQLQTAVRAAKSLQLGKDRINDAVNRGASPRAAGEELVTMRYDGTLQLGCSGKVALIVTALTDNRNRTAANVRAAVTKAGGELLSAGQHDWLFENVGVCFVSKRQNLGDVEEAGKTIEVSAAEGSDMEDALLEIALEGGATDFDFGDSDDDFALIKCDTGDLIELVTTMENAGYLLEEFEKRYMLRDEVNGIELDKHGTEKLESFLSKMEEDLDVTNVFHNALM